MARFQQTFASQSGFAKYGRKSKRELFLDPMNQVVPWSELLALVEPVYPKAGNGFTRSSGFSVLAIRSPTKVKAG